MLSECFNLFCKSDADPEDVETPPITHGHDADLYGEEIDSMYAHAQLLLCKAFVCFARRMAPSSLRAQNERMPSLNDLGRAYDGTVADRAALSDSSDSDSDPNPSASANPNPNPNPSANPSASASAKPTSEGDSEGSQSSADGEAAENLQAQQEALQQRLVCAECAHTHALTGTHARTLSLSPYSRAHSHARSTNTHTHSNTHTEHTHMQ